jgi:hypothetical protein
MTHNSQLCVDLIEEEQCVTALLNTSLEFAGKNKKATNVASTKIDFYAPPVGLEPTTL